jgi:hypothetical protein
LFAYTADPAPTVGSLGTSSGTTGGGTSVSIAGTNLLGTTQVLFGGVPAASFTITSDTSVTAVSPAEAAGTIDVRVESYSGISARDSGDRYSVTAASPPSVTGLGTSSGSTAGGTVVSISGTGFLGAGEVLFGGVEADFTVISDTSISATAPAGSAGVVDVVVVGPTGNSASGSADEFTFTAASAPSVAGLSVSTGSTGGGRCEERFEAHGNGYPGLSRIGARTPIDRNGV